MADNQKHTVKKHIGLILRSGVAILACWLAARGLDFGQIGKAFANISWWVPVGIVTVFILSSVILALRWWLFMRGWDIHIGYKSAVKLTFLGLYFNNFLPGSIGGDFVRAWYVAQHTRRRMASIISVFVDRVLALFGTILMAITAFVMAGQKGIFTGHEKSGIPNVFSENRTAILIIIAITVVICVGTMLASGVRHFLKALFYKMLRYGKKAIEQSLQAGLVLLRKPFLVVESLGLTFILQSMVIVSLWVLGRQIGIPTGWKGYFVFFSVMWIIGSIPISIAGIGIVEGGLIMLFTKFGSASPEAAAALALCQRVAWLIASLPGLAVYLAGQHLPTDFTEQFSVDEK